MLPIAGTVYNSVKLAMLDHKWQQKKENNKIFEKEMTADERLLNQYQEQIRQMQEKDPLNDISAKLKSGIDLTYEELEYLRKNNPELYREYMQIKAEKKSYENQLKDCKTKEEVDRLKMNKMGSFLAEAKSVANNPNIPKAKKLALIEKILMKTNAIQDVHMRFVESGQYSALPSQEEISIAARQAAEDSEEAAEELASEDREKASEEEKAKEQGEAELSGQETQAEEMQTEETQTEETQTEEIQEETETVDYQDVKSRLIRYIQNNRISGSGLACLAQELEMSLQAENPGKAPQIS